MRTRNIIISVFICSVLIISLCGFIPAKLQKENNTLIFAGDEDLAPYSYYNNDDLPTGFSVDLMRALSSTVYSFSSKNIQIDLMPWEDCLEAIKNGTVDGLIGIPLHKKRLYFVNYTQPISAIEFAIFVNSDNTYVNSLNSLEGTIVGIQKECPVIQELAKNEKIQILETEKMLNALEKLKNREVTAVIAEKNVALYYIQTNKIRGLKYVGTAVGPVYEITLAVKKTNTKLLKDLNLGIETLKESGTLSRLQRKWFGLQIFEPFPWKQTILTFGIIILLITFVLILLWVLSLNATVKAKTRQIRIMSEKMVEKDKLAILGKLAGQIAHELRTPLSIINNSVFLLRKEGSENRMLFEKRLHLLDEKVKLTSNILESILSYSRVKAALAKSISVKNCFEETLKDIEIPDGIKPDVKISNEEFLFVFMDFHQLYSVFRNLLLNSIQAMGDTGVLYVRLSASKNKDKIITKVCDTGKGIADSAQKKIFNLFYSSKITGTGLGLPISKSIVEANNGKLYLEETSDRGTCFILELPSYKAENGKSKRS